jgi:hypothetical protein
MKNLEILLFFHPMPPDPEARLSIIGLKFIEKGAIVEAIKREVIRHVNDGLVPGHWSEGQLTWFIDPELWACVHNRLVDMGYQFEKSDDPQWTLFKLKSSVKVLACRQHYSDTILWHLLTTERYLKAWEEKIRAVELFSKIETDVARQASEDWVKSEREQLSSHYEQLNNIKRELQDITSGAGDPGEDWLDSFEEMINSFYKQLD